MSLKRDLEVYLQFWLKQSHLEDLRLDKLDESGILGLIINDTTHFQIINNNTEDVEELYSCVKTIFAKLQASRKRKDCGDFTKTFEPLGKQLNLTADYHVFIFTIFLISTTRHSLKPNWYDLSLEDYCATDLTKTHTLIEIITIYSELVLTHCELLYCLDLISNTPLDTTVHKYCHIVFRDIADRYNQKYFTIKTIERAKIMFQPSDLGILSNLEELVQEADAVQSEVENQNQSKIISYVVLHIDLPKYSFIKYAVYTAPTRILRKNHTAVSVDQFLLHNKRFLHQKQNKAHTQLTELFFTRIDWLLQTKIYIDKHMAAVVSEMIRAELEIIRKELLDYLPNTLTDIEDINGVSSLLSSKVRRLTFLQKVNHDKFGVFLDFNKKMKDKGKLPLPFLDLRSVARGLFTDLNELGSLALFVLQFRNISALTKHSNSVVTKLQNRLIKLYMMRNFLEFTNFTNNNNLDFFYFSYYTDFRGRIYYDSVCSPQGAWYYRFIYHFGDVSSEICPVKTLSSNPKDLPNFVQEILKSIGFIFKNTCTEPTGEIYIEKILKLGLDIYNKYKEVPLKLYSLDYKTAIELYYYVRIINTLVHDTKAAKAWYLFKDTTCSMTQHAGKILGYRTLGLEKLNLSNETFAYDTYSLYVQGLKDHLRKLNPLIWETDCLTYLTRSTLKNLIMTIEYGVTYRTAYKEYLAVWNADLTIPDSIRHVLSSADNFLEIFNFLQDGTVNRFLFLRSRLEWTEAVLKSNFGEFMLDDLTLSNYYYYKCVNSVYYEVSPELRANSGVARERHSLTLLFDCYLNSDLYKKKTKNYKTKFSQRKTRTALYVNVIHSLDASYLRLITHYCAQAHTPLIVIHDGFGVPFYQAQLLTSIAAQAFNNSLDLVDQRYLELLQLKVCETPIRSATIII